MEPVRLRDLALQLDAEVVGDGEVMISGVAGFEHAGPDDITFLARPSLAGRMNECQAGAVIIGRDMASERPALRVDDPYGTFIRLLRGLAPSLDRLFPPGVHETAVVASTAELGRGVCLGPGAVVADGCRLGAGVRLGPHVVLEPEVSIGEHSLLYAHAVVRERCRLGRRVILHPGCVIGADGFGYRPVDDGLEKVPQIGIVILEDDVEVGAGACVDRATTGATVIGAGTKLDNLVQIGHNVRIGRWSVLCAQTGIGGSSTIGDGVAMGGQVGLGDHLHVGDRVRIGGKSGVVRNIPDGGHMFGYPALEARESMRIAAAMRRLPHLVKAVERLERLERMLQDAEIKGDG